MIQKWSVTALQETWDFNENNKEEKWKRYKKD